MSRRKCHPTVAVSVGKFRAAIDEGLVPLIRALWKRGYRTVWSCQDVGEASDDDFRRGWASVSFDDFHHAVRFMNTVVRFEAGGRGLYNKITHERCRGVRAWEYGVVPYDRSYDERSDSYGETTEPDVGFVVHVTFPLTDLPVVLERLETP